MNDREQFEQMMRFHGPRIYTLAIRLMGNEAAGADLAQDALVKAWEGWSRFRGDSDAGTWLYRICVNTWKNRVRSEKRRSFWKHFSIGARDPDGDGPEFDIASREMQPADRIARQDDQATVSAALAALAPEERGILIMAEVDEKPYDIIAAMLEIPVGTVRSRLSRARKKLKYEFDRRTGELPDMVIPPPAGEGARRAGEGSSREDASPHPTLSPGERDDEGTI